ncbi:hypothetical protein V6N13_149220 [Hibiscus sabdariffa]
MSTSRLISLEVEVYELEADGDAQTKEAVVADALFGENDTMTFGVGFIDSVCAKRLERFGTRGERSR